MHRKSDQLGPEELDPLIAQVVRDGDNLDEQCEAFLEVLSTRVAFGFDVQVLGVTARVEGVAPGFPGGLLAQLNRCGIPLAVPLASLALPAFGVQGGEWVLAYQRWHELARRRALRRGPRGLPPPAARSSWIVVRADEPDAEAELEDLARSVLAFERESLAGHYRDDSVIGRRCRPFLPPSGTEQWLALCEELVERAVRVPAGIDPAKRVAVFDRLFALVGRLGADDRMVVFEDEGGPYEIRVDWGDVLRAWFRALVRVVPEADFLARAAEQCRELTGSAAPRHLADAVAILEEHQRGV